MIIFWGYSLSLLLLLLLFAFSLPTCGDTSNYHLTGNQSSTIDN